MILPTIKNILIRYSPETITGIWLGFYFRTQLRSYDRNDEWTKREADMKIVEQLVVAGDSVIDAGANFGFYTHFLSKLVGTQGRVYSFEPISLTYRILATNVRKLSLDNVKVFNYAVSNRDGSETMMIPRFQSGAENFYQARIAVPDIKSQKFRRFPVQLRTLDSLSGLRAGKIALIKIDVEGHELPVIEGAESLIKQFMPALLIEVSGDPDNNKSAAGELLDRLKTYGYSPYWYDGSRLKPRVFGDKSINYFFLTQAHSRQVKNFIS